MEEKKDRYFILSESVSQSSVKDIIKDIHLINHHDQKQRKKLADYTPEPIQLVINTYGGSVYDGFALLSVIKVSKTPVHTYCFGKAMSMGFILFAAGHKRFMSKYATLMYHQIATGVWDKLDGIKQEVAECERLQKIYEDFILEHSNVMQDQMDAVKTRKGEWYIGADDAKKLGLTDVVLSA